MTTVDAHADRMRVHHGERAEYRFYFVALYPFALGLTLVRRIARLGRPGRGVRADSVFGEAAGVARGAAGFAFMGR